MTGHPYPRFSGPRIGYSSLIICFTIIYNLLHIVSGSGSNNNVENFDSELESSTGKWLLKDDEDTYFTFDGSKNVMTYSYVEDGISKYSGTFRVVSSGTSKDVATPLTFILKNLGLHR